MLIVVSGAFFNITCDLYSYMLQGAFKKLTIKYGKPFVKHYSRIQPVYGEGSYLRIMEMIEKDKIRHPKQGLP